MRTNIINLHSMFVVKTGKVFVYRNEFEDEYTFSDEVVDVCTGKRYGFDKILHLIGEPCDEYVERRNAVKRGRHSRSANKKALRHQRIIESFKQLDDDLPF